MHRPLLMEPDYRASPRDVFVRFAYLWLDISRQPHILSCVNHESLPEVGSSKPGNTVHQHEVPSWCPRWDYIPTGGSRLVDESYGNSFNAAKSTKFEFQPLPGDGDRLELRGFSCDVVVKTFDCLDRLTRELLCGHPEDLVLDIRNMANYIGLAILCYEVLNWAGDPVSSPHRSANDIIYSFATTSIAAPLCYDRDQTLGDFIPIIRDAREFSCNPQLRITAHYKDSLDEIARFCQRLHPNPPGRDSTAVMDSTNNLCSGRRLFICASGRLGLGPKTVEAGDQVCIIAGGYVPYVLRPFGRGRHLFVEESFVDGIMNGEATGEHEKSNAAWCDFELV